MNLVKIGCGQCTHYSRCPSQTKMFVNYCGSRRPTVELKIRTATEECKSRGGYFLKHTLPNFSKSNELEFVQAA